MFVQYKPKNDPGAGQSWDFVPDDVYQDEAELVEKHYGASWDDFLNGVRSGNARARKVLLWHLTRREHPRLSFADTPRFRMGELSAEFSSTELRELIDKMDRLDRTGLDEDRIAELDATTRQLHADLTDALLREHGGDVDLDKVDVPVGKAG